MIRFVLAALVVLCPVAVLAGGNDERAFRRVALPETDQDGAGLVGEGDHLRDGERHFLPPLSQYELTQLFEDDGSKPGVPKIGIVRNLASPVAISRRAVDRAAKSAAGSSTVGGWRSSRSADGRAIWTTSVSSPGAESIRLRFDRAVLPDNARVFVYGEGGERYGPYTRELLQDVTKGIHPFWTHTIKGGVAFVEVQLALILFLIFQVVVD